MERVWIYKKGIFKARVEQKRANRFQVDLYQGRSLMLTITVSTFKVAEQRARTWVEESGS